ncbi:hypothetical protein CR513_49833, partial [Mucuna pruriens]
MVGKKLNALTKLLLRRSAHKSYSKCLHTSAHATSKLGNINKRKRGKNMVTQVSVPFPQRLKDEKKDKQFAKFIEIFKQ